MRKCTALEFCKAFRDIHNNWSIDEFAEHVYGIDYRSAGAGRRKYVSDKWKLFDRAPVLFGFQLSPDNRRRFEAAIVEAAIRCSGQAPDPLSEPEDEEGRVAFDAWLANPPPEFSGTQPGTPFSEMLYFVWKAAWERSGTL